MLFEEFEPTTSLLYGHPCVKHSITDELCIIGQCGQIYKYNDEYGMCILQRSTGVETGIRFKNKDAKKYINKIKALPDSQAQLRG